MQSIDKKINTRRLKQVFKCLDAYNTNHKVPGFRLKMPLGVFIQFKLNEEESCCDLEQIQEFTNTVTHRAQVRCAICLCKKLLDFPGTKEKYSRRLHLLYNTFIVEDVELYDMKLNHEMVREFIVLWQER